MLSCSLLNVSTICFMKAPSPPVKPFQNASVTFSPSYGPSAMSAAWPPPGAPAEPPPHADTAAPTPSAAPMPSTPRRDRCSEERSFSGLDMSFLPSSCEARCGGVRAEASVVRGRQGGWRRLTAAQDTGGSVKRSVPSDRDVVERARPHPVGVLLRVGQVGVVLGQHHRLRHLQGPQLRQRQHDVDGLGRCPG